MNTIEHNSGFAPVYHGSLYYEVAGNGKPILLIHAGVADCSMWDDQFNHFSQHYQVIRYDTRGYGKSRSESTSFSNRQDGQATPQPLVPPAFNRLGEIHTPTLIMVGEYDTCSTLAAADELECQIPLSRKVGFPGVAHLIPLEQPTLFNEIVLSFVNEAL